MSHVSVYRRWRPQTFDDVIGQDRIVRTLQNAIRAGRTTHAYLFAGHRGTGKTTLARILAKALNCEHGPTAEPCNACVHCTAITQGNSLDVIEIDGASHTQVDHIRDLKERIVLAPTEGRYKVYIIDEVHMLSTSAFNALLKTLEEPPAHAIFVLVTTEPHRIPATVASRCQRFDFRRVPVREIETRLTRIASEEGFRVDQPALRHIARLADGSVRDAESILDQVSAYKDEGITTEDILTVLGAPADETVFALAGAVLSGNPVEVLRLAAGLLDEGKDPRQVMRTLVEHFRDLLVARVSEQAEQVLDTTPERFQGLQAQAAEARPADLLRALKILSDADVETRSHPQPRLLLEVSLIRMARPEMDATVDGLQARVEALEGRRESGSMPAPPAAPSRPARAPEAATSTAPPRPPQPVTPVTPPRTREPVPPPKSSRTPEQRRRAEGPQTAAPSPAPSLHESPRTDAVEPAPTLRVEDIRARWARVLEEVKRVKMICHAFLIEGTPIAVEGKIVVIGLRSGYNFHVDSLHRPENRTVVEDALAKVFGTRLRLQCRVQDDGRARTAPAATVGPAARAGDVAIEVDPLVTRAMELFGAEVLEVRSLIGSAAAQVPVVMEGGTGEVPGELMEAGGAQTPDESGETRQVGK